MIPVIDKPLLRLTERVLIWLEAWTGKDAAFWLAAVTVFWCIAITLLALEQAKVDHVGFCLGLLLVFILVVTVRTYSIPAKKAEVELANRRQAPVQADSSSYVLASVVRPVQYVMLLGNVAILLSGHGGLPEVLWSLSAAGCATFYLIVGADVYPSTGGRKQKQFLEKFRRPAKPVAVPA